MKSEFELISYNFMYSYKLHYIETNAVDGKTKKGVVWKFKNLLA